MRLMDFIMARAPSEPIISEREVFKLLTASKIKTELNKDAFQFFHLDEETKVDEKVRRKWLTDMTLVPFFSKVPLTLEEQELIIASFNRKQQERSAGIYAGDFPVRGFTNSSLTHKVALLTAYEQEVLMDNFSFAYLLDRKCSTIHFPSAVKGIFMLKKGLEVLIERDAAVGHRVPLSCHFKHINAVLSLDGCVYFMRSRTYWEEDVHGKPVFNDRDGKLDLTIDSIEHAAQVLRAIGLYFQVPEKSN